MCHTVRSFATTLAVLASACSAEDTQPISVQIHPGTGWTASTDARATSSDGASDELGIDVEPPPACLDDACIACRPCIRDVDCNPDGGVANRCLESGPDGRVCGTPCEEATDCSAAFECGAAGFCRFTGGEGCPCLDAFQGLHTVCVAQVGEATCQALRTCDEPCPAPAPADESCDGVDNDCDGETDEELGTSTCGAGICAHVVAVCEGGQAVACDPLLGAAAEACNLVDDDCDGLTDEELGTLACGTGACLQSVPACVDGQAVACDALLGAAPESCNLVDDDCDGLTDEELGTLPCGAGACAHTVEACAAGQPGDCQPLAGAAAETCNLVDDDCDGLTDEELGTLTCGAGPCATSVESCAGGVPQVCTPKPGSSEVCDGVDNDCDGQPDDGACPCPVASFAGHTYQFCASKVNWWTARDKCKKSAGYHLVTITSAEENTFVGTVAQANGDDGWWTGLTDEDKEGKWVWLNGEAVTWGPTWAPGEPNNSGNEDCAFMGMWPPTYPWVDAGCYEDARYVCEHD